MAASKTITLGSGKFYAAKYDGAVPEVSAICTEENRVGYIKGGATLTYTTSYYEAKDDFGKVRKKVLTEESAVFKTGLITWDLATLGLLCETAEVGSAGSSIKVGGIENATGQDYVIAFLHEDAVDGDKCVRMLGRNEAGFALAFANDKETSVDVEFAGSPMDDEGRLFYIDAIAPSA